MTNIEINERIHQYKKSIITLKKMMEDYDKNVILCGGFYSDMMVEINTQISHCEDCIKNLKSTLKPKLQPWQEKTFTFVMNGHQKELKIAIKPSLDYTIIYGYYYNSKERLKQLGLEAAPTLGNYEFVAIEGQFKDEITVIMKKIGGKNELTKKFKRVNDYTFVYQKKTIK